MKKAIQIICLLQLLAGVASAQIKIDADLQSCDHLNVRLAGISANSDAKLGYAFWLEREVLPGIWSMQERVFSLQPVAAFKTGKSGSYRISCTVERTENDGVERAPVLAKEGGMVSTQIHVNSCDATEARSFSGEEISMSGNIIIAPNPAKDLIRFFMKDGEIGSETSLYILDATGRVVLTENLTNSDQMIEVGSLESGLYFAQVRQQGATVYQQQLMIVNAK